MGFNGTPPAQKPAGQVSEKTQEVLDLLNAVSPDDAISPQPDTAGLLRALYEPALAAAVSINLIRRGDAWAAPFVGAAGVVLSQALEPLIAYFGDSEKEFSEVMERIGINVVPFAVLPDAPVVETPAAEVTDGEG